MKVAGQNVANLSASSRDHDLHQRLAIWTSAALRMGRMRGRAETRTMEAMHLAARFTQPRSAGLIGRVVHDPEPDHAHLTEPQHIGQMRRQILRDSHAAVGQHGAKPRDADIADFSRLRAKRRQRTFWISAVSQQSAQDSAVRAKCVSLTRISSWRRSSKPETSTSAASIFGLHLLAGSPVEIHNDGVLGSKVIIGGPERDAGVLPDVPHRGRFESPFPK